MNDQLLMSGGRCLDYNDQLETMDEIIKNIEDSLSKKSGYCGAIYF